MILRLTALLLAVFLAIAIAAYGAPVRAGECAGEVMVASHYGSESGDTTADGSFFDGSQMIAAHRTWKFGTRINVAYRGKSVDLTVRDRGPYIKGRSLDISTAAAQKIGLVKVGVDRVCVTRIR